MATKIEKSNESKELLALTADFTTVHEVKLNTLKAETALYKAESEIADLLKKQIDMMLSVNLISDH